MITNASHSGGVMNKRIRNENNFLFGVIPITGGTTPAVSFVHRLALLLSSSHYYDIISCLSNVLLSGLLSVRYRGVSQKMTHKKKQHRFHNVSKR